MKWLCRIDWLPLTLARIELRIKFLFIAYFSESPYFLLFILCLLSFAHVESISCLYRGQLINIPFDYPQRICYSSLCYQRYVGQLTIDIKVCQIPPINHGNDSQKWSIAFHIKQIILITNYTFITVITTILNVYKWTLNYMLALYWSFSSFIEILWIRFQFLFDHVSDS